MELVNKNGIEYYTIDQIEKIQSQMLKLLQIVSDICDENGLQYLLDGGTAIGAYRHGGFIPWDDDLDICLLKPDYLKLISILKRMDRSKYFLFDYEQNMHPCSYFGEKIDLFSCSDNKRRHIYPIKIDIIPLNVIENDESKIKENRIYRELSNFLFFGYCNEEFQDEALNCFRDQFQGEKKKFMEFYNMEYGTKEPNCGDILARPSITFSTPKVYEYQTLFPPKKICFSGMQSYVPSTDVVLRDIYGDYMNLPKLQDRKPEACRVFRARNARGLYDYLIDKNEKTRLQSLLFSIKATLLCK